MKKLGKKGIVCGVVVLAAAAGLLTFALNGNGGGGPQGGAPGGQVLAAENSVVRAAVPEQGSLSLETELTGTIEAADQVHVYAKASGDVTSVRVKTGDTVTKGQVLFTIDTNQVDSAKNSLDSAAVSLAEAQSNLARMQILYDGGDLSQQDYEQYANQVTSAQIQYNSAKLAYDQQVEYSSVTAPISGTIESCDISVYDLVNQNGELCVITGTGEQKLTFYVTQRMLDSLNLGDPVNVSQAGNTCTAYITEINSSVDSGTGLFEIEAQLSGDLGVATGSTVTLSLTTSRAENAMLIPVDAVYYSGGDAYVYLYQDGVASKADVEVGIYDSDKAEILSGLTYDDMVISTWSSNLYEGANVKLMDDDSTVANADTGESQAADAEGAVADGWTAADEENAVADGGTAADEESAAADGQTEQAEGAENGSQEG